MKWILRVLVVVLSLVAAVCGLMLGLALDSYLRERAKPVYDVDRHVLAAEERRGDGPPVLLLHGLAGSSAIWSRTVENLPGEPRLLLPDLLGFGDSPKIRAEYGIETHLTALDRLLEQRSFGEGQPLLIVGHSLGSILALAWANANPERVRELVLVSLPYYGSREAAVRSLGHGSWMRRGMLTGNPAYKLLCYAMHGRNVPFIGLLTSLPAEVAQDGLEHNWLSVKRSLEHVVLDSDVSRLARRARSRMTWMHGRQDEVVPFEAVRRLASELDPAPRWIPIQNAGHDLPLSNSEPLAQAIVAALDRES